VTTNDINIFFDMKIFYSYIFRALFAIVMGVLLIQFPDDTMVGITIAIGVLFFLSGVVSIASYMSARKHTTEYEIYDAQGRLISGKKPMFPLVGIGSVLLGIILAVMPTVFVSWLMYILGFALVMAALAQLVAFFSARRIPVVGWGFAVCPLALLLAGIFVIFYPLESASAPLLILGWCLLLYGVTECVNETKYYLNRRRARKMAEHQADGEPVTEENQQLVSE